MMKGLIAIGVFLGGVLLAALLFNLGPEPESFTPEPLVPVVEFVVAEPQTHRFEVRAEGLVEARVQTDLMAEVSGRVVSVASIFESGAVVEPGTELLRLDPISYEAALAEAEAREAAARLILSEESARRTEATREWEALNLGTPSDLTLRRPQMAKASADLAAAERAVALARQQLERTVVRAPFTGRLRATQVNLGTQVVANGTILAVLDGIERAEIPVPLALEDLKYLAVNGQGQVETEQAARVELAIGGEIHTWEGRLDRLEGVVDRRSRMVRAVVVVPDPYGLTSEAGATRGFPLKVGLFVSVVLPGRELENVFRLPRGVMVRADQVELIDTENRLHRRTVEVAQTTPGWVVVTAGLEAGDRLNLTPIDFFVEGMRVAPEPQGQSANEATADEPTGDQVP